MAPAGHGEQPSDRHDDAEIPLMVYGCSRIGMQANPPGRRLRFGWRRGA